MLVGGVQDVNLNERMCLDDEIGIDRSSVFLGTLGEESNGSVYGAGVVPGSPVSKAWGRTGGEFGEALCVSIYVDASLVFGGINFQ